MKIHRITINGLTTYREPTTLDLEALGPGLIAISGPNGSGKTTLLEAVPGGIYRRTPSRGSIAALVAGRDASIDLVGENGEPFSIHLDIDAAAGRQEAVIFNGAGDPLAGPKVRDFDRYIYLHFPSFEVYLASCFASQTGAGSILRMSRSDRRALFVELLGVEGIETLAGGSRARATGVETELATLRASGEAVRAGAEDVALLLEAVEKAGLEAAAAEERSSRAFYVLQGRRNELAEAKGALQRSLDALATAQEAEKKADSAGREVDNLLEKHGIFAPLLEKSEEIRETARKIKELEGTVEAAKQRASVAVSEFRAAGVRAKAASTRAEAAGRRRRELELKLEAASKILAAAGEIKAGGEEIDRLASEVDRLAEKGEGLAAEERQAVEAWELRRQARQEFAETLAETRRQKGSLEERRDENIARDGAAEDASSGVPCARVLEDEVRAGCPALVAHFETRRKARVFLDRAAAEIIALASIEEETLGKLKATEILLEAALQEKNSASIRVAKGREEYRESRARLQRLRLGDRRDELVRAEAEVAALTGSLEQATAEADEATAARAGVEEEVDRREEELRTAQNQLEIFSETLRGHQSRDRLAELEKAEREEAEVRGRLKAARATAAAALEEARTLRAAVVPPNTEQYNEASKKFEEAETDAAAFDQAAEETRTEKARLETRLEAARKAADSIAALSGRVRPLELSLRSWRWLARALGREGVQALELDVAGPRVATLANELLSDAYGSRFRVRFDTLAAKADGKGVRETFDLVVVDAERGREGEGEDLSGGEKVIIGEALGLAVGLFHAQASGVALGTVFRDETVGALDPENGERYLAMLRAFLRVGKVHQLIYVAHQPALVELADAVVRVVDGRIELR